jgi:ribosomal protein L1
MREYDKKRQPSCHYNLHIQPASGGLDYHNYHIRYVGIREDKHVWSVVDAPAGKEKSHRIYAFSKEHFIREAIDAACSLLVTDMTNDVGDPSLWGKLAEDMALVLFDLYRHDLEKMAERLA